MQYLLIQALINLLIFTFSPGVILKFYKIISYIVFPILTAILMVYPKEGISLNENDGFALDITILTSRYFLTILGITIVIQYLFNNYLLPLIRNGSWKKKLGLDN